MVSFISFLPLLLTLTVARTFHNPYTFNVVSYGAVPNRITDNSKAFLRAWNDACGSKGGGRVLVPKGMFMLDSVVFVGPCNGPVDFIIKGSLEATSNPSKFFVDHWIGFKYVDQLLVGGGGYLLGHGGAAWRYNDCRTNSQCRSLPVTMRFDFVTNSKVSHIHSINSKNAHFNLFACHNLNMSHVRIIAPEDSPNTDGIRIGSSSNIMIMDSDISTGDDCIAMIAGSQNITVSGVQCGPGHGFSIGSLGGSHTEEFVSGIVIQNCTLRGTQNGIRIKTWAPSLPSLASDILFDNIVMENVNNPIFIDQQYCPRPPCNWKAQSKVKIKNVTFRRVRGTSSSKVAVKMQCSQHVPCEGVKLVNINLTYRGREGRVTSSCLNVQGKSYGPQLPAGCL
ncbi:exopolygalacturonase-like [Rutidosis leptorrhynchoides]|uniref:exopolygalacturonase-like n=1 Tax=Rutidosis leptorrhynchoides TaxID=125765 RepID=UPI003A9A2D17